MGLWFTLPWPFAETSVVALVFVQDCTDDLVLTHTPWSWRMSWFPLPGAGPLGVNPRFHFTQFCFETAPTRIIWRYGQACYPDILRSSACITVPYIHQVANVPSRGAFCFCEVQSPSAGPAIARANRES